MMFVPHCDEKNFAECNIMPRNGKIVSFDPLFSRQRHSTVFAPEALGNQARLTIAQPDDAMPHCVHILCRVMRRALLLTLWRIRGLD